MLKAGDAFLMESPGSTKPHLWIVLSDPDNDGMVAFVNVTKSTSFNDNTTCLGVGDHLFIKKPSVINYAGAQKADARLLEFSLPDKSLQIRELPPISTELLTRIRNGLFSSDETTDEMIDYCDLVFGVLHKTASVPGVFCATWAVFVHGAWMAGLLCKAERQRWVATIWPHDMSTTGEYFFYDSLSKALNMLKGSHDEDF